MAARPVAVTRLGCGETGRLGRSAAWDSRSASRVKATDMACVLRLPIGDLNAGAGQGVQGASLPGAALAEEGDDCGDGGVRLLLHQPMAGAGDHHAGDV